MKDYIINDITVEWDDQKNDINKKKHGISFRTAAYVFADPYRVEMYDEGHSFCEERYIVIGVIEKMLLVVYTMHMDNIRLISVRIATREEEEFYYEYNKGIDKTWR
ncbi:MAG: BrnT family toxin [Mogibacterium sp.]|nr:BrnT family toxin [Mogibacterium sp.]